MSVICKCFGAVGLFTVGVFAGMFTVSYLQASDDTFCESYIKITNPKVYEKIAFTNAYTYCKEFMSKEDE